MGQWGSYRKFRARAMKQKVVFQSMPDGSTAVLETVSQAQALAQITWLRSLAEKGGKGTVNAIDARSLGRVADTLAALAPAAEVGEQTHLVSEIHRQHKEIERLRAEIQWLRAALQRIVDKGEQSGFAYGIAFTAIRALKDK